MYPLGLEEQWVKERSARLLAEAEVRRLVRLAGGTTLRARAARMLFEFAVVLEREEAWRAVWEKLEAPRRS